MKRGKPKAVPPHGGAGAKQPRTIVGATASRLQEHPTFSFRYADRDYEGEWGWPEAEGLARVIDFLCDISSNTWADIRNQTTNTKRAGHRKHHEMPFDGVCDEALRRIQQRRFDEQFEELFRFRLDGRARLWGFQSNGVFYPVWWDPEHKVYPTDTN